MQPFARGYYLQGKELAVGNFEQEHQFGASMKHTLTAAAISLSMITAATGAMAQVWQGDMYITAITGCAGSGHNVGDFGQGVFSPAAFNGAADRLALFGMRGSAVQLTPSTGTTLTGAKSFTVTTITHTTGAGQYTSVAEGPFTVTPQAPASNQQTVTITGPMMNFGNITGCTVTLHGVLYLVP